MEPTISGKFSLLNPTVETHNPIDEYLDDLTITAESYSDLRNAVERSDVHKHPPPWMTDLYSLNFDKKDDIEFATELLYTHYLQRPWALSEDVLSALHEQCTRLAEADDKDNTRPAFLPQSTPYHDETIEGFVSRSRRSCLEYPMGYTLFNEDIARESGFAKPQSMFSSQFYISILGVAGYRPDEIILDENIQGKAKVDAIIANMKQHVDIIRCSDGYEASVCLDASVPNSAAAASSSWNDERLESCISKVLGIFSRIKRLIQLLQRDGRIESDIIYLYHPDVYESGQIPAKSSIQIGSVVETRHLKVEEIRTMIENMEKLVEAFAQPRERKGLRGFARSLLPVLPVLPLMALGPLAPLAMGLGILLPSVFGFGTNWWSSASSQAQSDLIVKLGQTMWPVIREARIPGWTDFQSIIEPRPDVNSMQRAVHILALTAQSISLTFQGYLNDFEAPLQIDDFLDRPIDRVRLCGIDRSQKAIYLVSKTLPVYPEKKFLILQCNPSKYQVEVDGLQITPVLAMKLFKPSVLFADHPKRGTFPRSCVAIGSSAGQMVPSDYVDNEAFTKIWQWQDTSDSGFSPSTLATKGFFGVGLHDEITVLSMRRIDVLSVAQRRDLGLTHSGGSTSAVGASTPRDATANINAPKSTHSEEVSDATDTSTSKAAREQSVEGGGGGDDPGAGNPSTGSDGNICPWESAEMEDSWREKLDQHVFPLYSPQSGFMLKSIQLALQFHTPFLNAQLMSIHEKKLPGSNRITSNSPRQNIYRLNERSYVLLSLHTGIFRRVNLRELLAYMLERAFISTNACRVKSQLISFLRSSESVASWQDRIGNESNGINLVEKLNELTQDVEDMLRGPTGLTNKNNLHAFWPGETQRVLKITQQKFYPMKMFRDASTVTDTSKMATSVCVVNSCIQTPECKCPMATTLSHIGGGHDTISEWREPSSFRLYTRATAKLRSSSTGTEETISFTVGKSYWLENPRFGLLAKVIGQCENSEAYETEIIYYLDVQEANIPFWMMRRFARCPIAGEFDPGAGSRSCVIGSGQVFRSSIQEYLQSNRPAVR